MSWAHFHDQFAYFVVNLWEIMYLSHARNYGHAISSVLLMTNSKIHLAKIKQWIFHNVICLAAWIGHLFLADISVCFFVDGGYIAHWHEIPSFQRLWPAYPLSLSPWQLRNKLQAAPSLLYPAEWKFIYDVSSFTFQTPAMTWPLVTKCHEVCQCHCCMDGDT